MESRRSTLTEFDFFGWYFCADFDLESDEDDQSFFLRIFLFHYYLSFIIREQPITLLHVDDKDLESGAKESTNQSV